MVGTYKVTFPKIKTSPPLSPCCLHLHEWCCQWHSPWLELKRVSSWPETSLCSLKLSTTKIFRLLPSSWWTSGFYMSLWIRLMWVFKPQFDLEEMSHCSHLNSSLLTWPGFGTGPVEADSTAAWCSISLLGEGPFPSSNAAGIRARLQASVCYPWSSLSAHSLSSSQLEGQNKAYWPCWTEELLCFSLYFASEKENTQTLV